FLTPVHQSDFVTGNLGYLFPESRPNYRLDVLVKPGFAGVYTHGICCAAGNAGNSKIFGWSL
ncbi:hypothetical protein, partial [uncultured Nostoc sp.]|uniref:hypothetical protein n=1 Tax=uncultured Nostoc sp. TaxID=340711 RepID=UPI0035CC7E66